MTTHKSFADLSPVEKVTDASVQAITHGKFDALDVALVLLDSPTAASQDTLTPQEAKRLVRKIDSNLLPLLCLVFTGKQLGTYSGQ